MAKKTRRELLLALLDIDADADAFSILSKRIEYEGADDDFAGFLPLLAVIDIVLSGALLVTNTGVSKIVFGDAPNTGNRLIAQATIEDNHIELEFAFTNSGVKVLNLSDAIDKDVILRMDIPRFNVSTTGSRVGSGRYIKVEAPNSSGVNTDYYLELLS